MANGFVGRNTADMSTPVQRITELTETERGLSCVMQLVADLVGDGVVNDNKLTDNEEELINDSQEIYISMIRHGVKSAGRMAEQATVIRFRAQAKDKLAFWLSEKTDELLHLVAAGRAFTLNTDGSTRGASELPQLNFAAQVTAASSGRLLYGGDATGEGDLVAGDTMTWNLLVGAQAFAKRKKIKPVMSQGRQHYIVLMTTEQLRDLKLDSNYQTLVSKAAPRGDSNPLFKNAIAVVDGLVIHEHNKCFNTLGAVSGTAKWGTSNTVDGGQALLLGAQALGLATIGNAFWEEADTTDYSNRPGVAYGRMLGMLKPQYISRADGNVKQDFGVVCLKTAAAPTYTYTAP
jgi:N4-gp56 family major capsid protein